MVKFIVDKIRPGRGFAHTFHLSFIAFIPLLLWALVRLELNGIAVVVLLLSKWRMFAVQPRHWINHMRTNAVDIIVGLSILEFIIQSDTAIFQGLWVLAYEVWLLFIKPGSSNALVSLQALTAQAMGTISLFLAFPDANLLFYVLGIWLVCYFSARHFLAIFYEVHGILISSIWGFLAASIMWVLGHWLLFFGSVSQPAVVLSVLGFGLSALYYLDQHDRLARATKRQILMGMFALLLVIIVFSDWGDKAV